MLIVGTYLSSIPYVLTLGREKNIGQTPNKVTYFEVEIPI